MTEQVAVVHNGIIENFQELRKFLEKKGIKHTTETDTETIALLTQAMIEEGNEPIEAARKTIEKLTGAFALCFLFQGQNDLMIAARKGSPICLRVKPLCRLWRQPLEHLKYFYRIAYL